MTASNTPTITCDRTDLLRTCIMDKKNDGPPRLALLLSGGGTHGMTHIGVIRALYTAGVLPQIVSGTSAGAIVAAVLCTRRDDQILDTIDNRLIHGNLNVFVADRESHICRERLFYLLQRRCYFDAENLRAVMKGWLGDLTFREAYEISGRVLCITVCRADRSPAQQLLNYRTAPDCVIWSAVVASCAVPFFFEGAPLYYKDPQTAQIMTSEAEKAVTYLDGSLACDIPKALVRAQFDVDFCIAVQVNPHVRSVSALRAMIDTWGVVRMARSLITSRLWTDLVSRTLPVLAQTISWWDMAAIVASADASNEPKVDSGARFLSFAGISSFLFAFVSRSYAIVRQEYTGDITVLPNLPFSVWGKILVNPTEKFMRWAVASGEQATTPWLPIIRHHMGAEQALTPRDGSKETKSVAIDDQNIETTSARARPCSRGRQVRRSRSRSCSCSRSRSRSRSASAHRPRYRYVEDTHDTPPPLSPSVHSSPTSSNPSPSRGRSRSPCPDARSLALTPLDLKIDVPPL